MFYDHYKGGIYYTLGLTKFIVSSSFNLMPILEAIHTEDECPVRVIMSRQNHFFVENESYTDHMLYLGQDGRLWLRPRKMFHGLVEVDGEMVKRFKLSSMQTDPSYMK